MRGKDQHYYPRNMWRVPILYKQLRICYRGGFKYRSQLTIGMDGEQHLHHPFLISICCGLECIAILSAVSVHVGPSVQHQLHHFFMASE
jgi:hypothetical protein